LQYVFRRNEALALWKKDGITLCCFKHWSGSSLNACANEKFEEFCESLKNGKRLFSLSDNNSNDEQLTLITNILKWFNSSLIFNDFLNLVAEIQGVAEISHNSLDDEIFADSKANKHKVRNR
jgi:hypothetical protein